jgi:hypothetical protein
MPPPPCATPVVARVQPGDTLHGHLVQNQSCQCFYFDAVEYSLLDVEMTTDVGNVAAPHLEIYAPDGQKVPLGADYGPEGSSCLRGSGIVLPKTGTYRGTVCKTACEPEHYWAFKYHLRVLSPDEQKAHLTACTSKSWSFVAPAAAHCVISVRPDANSKVRPKVKAIKDPDGGAATAAAAAPCGRVPTLARGCDDSVTVDFAAPKSGRYTLEVTAEPGCEGDAVVLISVMPCAVRCQDLYHDGHGCPEAMATPTVPKAAATSDVTPTPGLASAK